MTEVTPSLVLWIIGIASQILMAVFAFMSLGLVLANQTDHELLIITTSSTVGYFLVVVLSKILERYYIRKEFNEMFKNSKGEKNENNK